MELRQLRAGETDHEVVWLSVSSASAALAEVWFRSRLPLPGCAFHQLTGQPCPACGATRCLRDLLGGHFAAAFHWNPLFFCVLAGVILFDFYALTVLVFRLPRARLSPFPPSAARALRSAAIAMVAANWLYLVAAGR